MKDFQRKNKSIHKNYDYNLNTVVIGVPVNASERKKESIKRAAHLAGFNNVHMLIESTAAAVSYGLLVAGSKTVLIFDIGGGTTDITIMKIQEGSTYDIEAVGGYNDVG